VMEKYLFLTYGSEGWRGVQVRGLAIAAAFPEKSKIVFWNGYDSSFIAQAGYAVETKHMGLTDPNDIVFPKGIKAVIFADIPTNEFFNEAVFEAAIKRGIPVFLTDNLYRRGQLKETVYAYFIDRAARFYFNGPSSFAPAADKKVRVVPPFITYRARGDERGLLGERFHIPPKHTVLFGVGYLPEVRKSLERLHNQLKNLPVSTLIVGVENLGKPRRKNGITYLPFIAGEDFHRYMAGADIVVTKFGYLQILEAMALRKPVIAVGGGGYVLQGPEVLDLTLRKFIVYDPEAHTGKAVAFIRDFIRNPRRRKSVQNQLASLDNGEIDGAKVIAKDILSTLDKGQSGVQVSPTKRLVVLLNSEDKLYQRMLTNLGAHYLVHLIASAPQDPPIVKRPDENLLAEPAARLAEPLRRGEILPAGYREVLVFTRRKYDGFTVLGPWFNDWVRRLTDLIEGADEVLVSPVIKSMLGPILKKAKKLQVIAKSAVKK
jgi:glycosyltransferase involved in cell wall biosynthesis